MENQMEMLSTSDESPVFSFKFRPCRIRTCLDSDGIKWKLRPFVQIPVLPFVSAIKPNQVAFSLSSSQM